MIVYHLYVVLVNLSSMIVYYDVLFSVLMEHLIRIVTMSDGHSVTAGYIVSKIVMQFEIMFVLLVLIPYVLLIPNDT